LQTYIIAKASHDGCPKAKGFDPSVAESLKYKFARKLTKKKKEKK